MAKRRKLLMSAELKQMLQRPRTGPIRPRVQYDDQGRSLIECDTRRQLALYLRANRILGKAGFFTKEAPTEQDDTVDIDMIGVHGLRPTWHGRA